MPAVPSFPVALSFEALVTSLLYQRITARTKGQYHAAPGGAIGGIAVARTGTRLGAGGHGPLTGSGPGAEGAIFHGRAIVPALRDRSHRGKRHYALRMTTPKTKLTTRYHSANINQRMNQRRELIQSGGSAHHFWSGSPIHARSTAAIEDELRLYADRHLEADPSSDAVTRRDVRSREGRFSDSYSGQRCVIGHLKLEIGCVEIRGHVCLYTTADVNSRVLIPLSGLDGLIVGDDGLFVSINRD